MTAAGDRVLDVDWAEHWRVLLRARREQVGGPHQRDFWDRRASGFVLTTADGTDDVPRLLAPWLEPDKTVLDVGAGAGRHAAWLAARVRAVTAVEPSAAMRAHIPRLPNLSVVAGAWEGATVERADLVICVHVLYSVREVVPFLEKLEDAAAERVFVVMRDTLHTHPAERIAGPGRARQPLLRDCLMILRQMGIAPDVAMFTNPTTYRFADLDAAVAECLLSLGPRWDAEEVRAWLQANLRQERCGTLSYEGGEVTSGMLHWTPAR